jgi:hypothetical protein
MVVFMDFKLMVARIDREILRMEGETQVLRLSESCHAEEVGKRVCSRLTQRNGEAMINVDYLRDLGDSRCNQPCWFCDEYLTLSRFIDGVEITVAFTGSAQRKFVLCGACREKLCKLLG